MSATSPCTSPRVRGPPQRAQRPLLPRRHGIRPLGGRALYSHRRRRTCCCDGTPWQLRALQPPRASSRRAHCEQRRRPRSSRRRLLARGRWRARLRAPLPPTHTCGALRTCCFTLTAPPRAGASALPAPPTTSRLRRLRGRQPGGRSRGDEAAHGAQRRLAGESGAVQRLGREVQPRDGRETAERRRGVAEV